MERMYGIDAFSIYGATSTSPFATLKVTLYEPVDPNDVPDASEIRSFVKTQVERLGGAFMGMRIVRVPFDLHHPVWVSDPAYSPDDHIYHTALPPPGDKAQLCEFLSDLMGRPLDPDRPLWEVWLVEGLEGGKIAIASKVHHALADGKMVATLLAHGHLGTGPSEASSVRKVAEPIPGKARLLFDALVDLLKTYTDEVPQLYRELREVRRMRKDAAEAEVSVSSTDETEDDEPLVVPFTVFNERAGGRYRVYRWETFSLGAFKRLSRIFACTMNTLVLGVCSEALKRYLADVSTLPAESLVTAMPVGDRVKPTRRTRLHPGPPHNSVAVAVLSLHTDVEDFGERLQAIQRSSKAAVEHVQRSYGKRFDNFLELLPGTVIRWGSAFMERQQAKRSNPYANAVISNVHGPGDTLYALDGRLRLVELLSTGNLHDLGNLNITVWSYVDNLSFSFYMRKGALPEPEKLPAYVRQVVEELERRELAEATALPG